MSIASNIELINNNIAAACKRVGRSANGVKLIAVCKYTDTLRIQQALDCGICTVGENRAQEVTEKLNFYKQNGCSIHFIGQLQTNKIKYLCGNVSCIQSVDRLQLAQAINSLAFKKGICQDIMIQVNIGNEPQKGGVAVDELDGLLASIETMPNLNAIGLMCVPPSVDGEQVRGYFASMRTLLANMQQGHPKLPLKELSMGMSHDYQIAIEEGATFVRVGTAIFGQRITPNLEG